MTALLDLDTPARYPERPVSRRWFLGSLLGAAGAVALARGFPGRHSTLAPTLSTGRWGSFAGSVPGCDLYLLVAVDVAGAVIAHASDGTGLAVWFAGRAREGAVDLPGSERGGSTAHRLVARVERNRVEGAVTLDGVARSFALGPTGPRGGLFAARTTVDDVTYAASWIVLGNGRQRGVFHVGRVTGPAPRLDEHGARTEKGVLLDAVRVDRFSRKWGRLTRS